MTIMHFDTTSAASLNYVVNLGGSGIINVTGTSSVTCGWEFLNTGYVRKREIGAYITYNIGTDWITPRTGFDPADYQVRGDRYAGSTTYINFGGNSRVIDDPGAPVDGWYDLDVTRSFYYTLWTYSTGPTWANRWANGSYRFEIRHKTDASQNTKTSVIDGASIMDESTNYYYFMEVGTE